MLRPRRRRGLPDSGRLRRSLFFGSLILGALGGGCELRELPPREGSDLPADPVGAPDEIEAMLHASARSWNEGDLEGFMDDYWRSDSLTFSGSGGVTRGWEGVRSRYRSSYFAPGAEREHLRFDGIEITLLGPEQALALGRYVLSSPQDTTLIRSSGFFSLVLRSVDGAWRIVHDHTSASPPAGEGR